ncbi:MAG: sigma 54-interacting transcriptional regulator [Desulfonatronovibrionaceae bacterium]
MDNRPRSTKDGSGQTLLSSDNNRFGDRGFEPLSGSKPRIVGETPGILEVKKLISKVASLDCTVLISGETGTGKELVSRAIHQKSSRGRGKFLAINCSAFGQDLLNNELFGYERETYSGNVRIKKGLFEAAQGGTILLDEICETPPAMQTHLLRVLEDKLIIRSGGTEEIPVDVRVLAATNQRLSKKMEDREFRRDLYYRLNTFVLRIPPLRERKEDIPLLANFFLGKYRKEYGKDIDRISGEAMQVLMDYSFPGNVRDLEHAIERAIIVSEEREILPEHLPQRFKGQDVGGGQGGRNRIRHPGGAGKGLYTQGFRTHPGKQK